jgi:hypothetical protein
MTSRGPNQTPMTTEELRLLKEASEVQALRDSSAFIKVHRALETAVAVALNDLEINTNPHADAYYKIIWQSRKHMLATMDEFIDGIIQQRRDTVQEFFRALGIPEDRIAQNLDANLDFLERLNIFGGPHVNP